VQVLASFATLREFCLTLRRKARKAAMSANGISKRLTAHRRNDTLLLVF
jgi:hypothetical protein